VIEVNNCSLFLDRLLKTGLIADYSRHGVTAGGRTRRHGNDENKNSWS